MEGTLSEKRCRVVVMASGTGSNFGAIAEACRNGNIPASVAGVITDNPDAGVLELARSYDVEARVIEPPTKKAGLPAETENDIVAVCRELQADLIALAGFMRILKGSLLDTYEGRIMNIHPSLLPSFKGLDGVGQALEYGAKVVGCTVHFVDRSVDGGAKTRSLVDVWARGGHTEDIRGDLHGGITPRTATSHPDLPDSRNVM